MCELALKTLTHNGQDRESLACLKRPSARSVESSYLTVSIFNPRVYILRSPLVGIHVYFKSTS